MYNLIQIQNLIYEIRGLKVMLDSDLAKLYGVKTSNLNKANGKYIKLLLQQFREHSNCLISFYFKKNGIQNQYNNRLFISLKELKHYFIPRFILDIFNIPRDVMRIIKKLLRRII